MHGMTTSRAAHFVLAAIFASTITACSDSAPSTGDGSRGGTVNNGGANGGPSGGGGANGGGGGTSGGGGMNGGGGSGGGGNGGSGGGGGGGGGVDAGGGQATDAGVTPPPSGAYPPGPYGRTVGATFPNLALMGYRNGAGAWTQIQISDYYDPDGTRGLRALYVTLGEVGCGACVQEAPHINQWKMQYAQYGTAFLSALWRGEVKNPDNTWSATQSTVDGWISQFSITYDMAADPKILLNDGVEPQDNPNGYLVDTRTMKVVQYYPGAPGMLFGLVQLLKKNGATGL
jgi:hypothetical protein